MSAQKQNEIAVAEPTTFEKLPELAPDSKLPMVAEAMVIQDVDNIIPTEPDHLTPARSKEIMGEAEALAQAIVKDPNDLEITSKIYGLGDASMHANTQHVALMDAKIGPVLKEVSTDSSVGMTLTQIKAQLDLVNPNIVGSEEIEVSEKVLGFFNKTVNVVVRSLPGANQKIMEMINERRDTVDSTVETLRQHLFREQDKALKNAVELAQVADQLTATKEDLREAVYLGQLLWQRLNQLTAGETDPSRQQAFMYLKNDLAMRVVDLQTVDQLNMQSRMGAETLINNSRGLKTLVHRVANILLPSVRNALVVKAAAAQQAQLAAASHGIMEAAGDTIAQTSKDIRAVTTDVARMNTEGMLDLEKLEVACAEFEAMKTDLEVIFTQAEKNARGVSMRMGQLNERMARTVDPMTAARHAREQARV